MHYLALLRGINVGGKNFIKMAELKTCLEQRGLEDVTTYIQSGNVLFESSQKDTRRLAAKIETAVLDTFKVTSGAVVIEKSHWQKIITAAPKAWGKDPDWKHNLLVLLEPYNMREATAAIGELKPGIETLIAGDGVLYQSMSRALFGRTTTGKIASNPIYKRMTVRNYNTSVKLLGLLEKR